MDTRRAWWQAARPHTLPAAATPVLVGAGLATGDAREDAWAWLFAWQLQDEQWKLIWWEQLSTIEGLTP